MKPPQPQWFKLAALILVISLTAGCGGKSTPAPFSSAPAPSGVTAERLLPVESGDTLARAAVEFKRVNAQDAGQREINQAEQNVKTLLRDTGGARAALGEQAGTLFEQIDAAEFALVQRLVDQLKALSGSAALARPARSSTAVQMVRFSTGPFASAPVREPFENFMGIWLGIAITASFFADAARDKNGMVVLPVIEKDDNVPNKRSGHFALRPTLKGSVLEIDIDMVVSAVGPPAYQEKTTGKLTINLCPDAQGNVPLTLKMKTAYSESGSGNQWEVTVQDTGHVSDEGRLASVDMEIQTGVAVQSAGSGSYVEVKTAFTLNGFDQPPDKMKASEQRSEYVRNSAHPEAAAVKAALEPVHKLVWFLALYIMNIAEEKWTKGYCLEIRVPEIPDGKKIVERNSETPFQATVWHKFDAKDLTLPVTAVLADGKVSVTRLAAKCLPRRTSAIWRRARLA